MFKIGDKVRRIKNKEFVVWECSIYSQCDPSGVLTISKVFYDEYTTACLQLEEVDCTWMAENFELVTESTTKTMISLKEHKTALVNLGVTIDAIEELGKLIKYYSEDKAGPAYISFKYTPKEKCEAQIDRSIMVTALKEQKQKLVDYLATLGIDASDES